MFDHPVVTAVARGIRTSPSKMRLVADLVRRMPVDKALVQLAFSKKRIAIDVRKCLQSAIANAENNHDMNIDNLVVSEIFVDKGLVMKRMRPRARGRSGKIQKFFSNLTIKLTEVDRV